MSTIDISSCNALRRLTLIRDAWGLSNSGSNQLPVFSNSNLNLEDNSITISGLAKQISDLSGYLSIFQLRVISLILAPFIWTISAFLFAVYRLLAFCMYWMSLGLGMREPRMDERGTILPRLQSPDRAIVLTMAPLSCLLLFGHIFSMFALDRIPISVLHSVKVRTFAKYVCYLSGLLLELMTSFT